MKRSRSILQFGFSFGFRDPRTRDAIVSVKPFPQIKKTATLATKGYERDIWGDLLTTGRTARFSPLHAHHTEGTRHLVSRSINTVTFVASATASSSRSDDDAMSVTSWRRSDKEIDAVPPPPFGLIRVAGDLCVARRRRCPGITSSSRLDLPSQAPSANVMVFMERDTVQFRQDRIREPR